MSHCSDQRLTPCRYPRRPNIEEPETLSDDSGPFRLKRDTGYPLQYLQGGAIVCVSVSVSIAAPSVPPRFV